MKNFKGFNTVAAIICVAVLAFIGVATWLVIDGNNKATNFDNYDFNSVIAPDEHNGNIGDHAKTDKNGSYTGEPVYIFEYADFQCEACASMNPRVNQVVDDLDGKLVIVYRNYLLSYHQNATAAASAAEAAGLQGYWKEYGDALFSNQSEWYSLTGSERTSTFEKYFIEVTNGKGDLEKFKKDMSSNEVSKKISFDMGIGKRINIEGTPTFYIDGQWIDWANTDKSETDSVIVNGETLTWEGAQTGEKFINLIKQIVETKLKK
ncbi:thioredoxin domain-containing protein [Candidatus Saccharibacteria bacterium]|nr:thioredoxin domain-containing protein [Candidatus Saccharibacteria bacterium]